MVFSVITVAPLRDMVRKYQVDGVTFLFSHRVGSDFVRNLEI